MMTRWTEQARAILQADDGPDSDPTLVRVGRIEFVNCFPLYHFFADELARRGFSATIVEGDPTTLNGMLARGEIDVALPSSIAFARQYPGWALLPHVSISAFGAVDSVQLFARRPLEELRRIALTPKSATSVCLLRVLLAARGQKVEFVTFERPDDAVAAGADARLLIGDEALQALREDADEFRYDLATEWLSLTGKPMVFAVCAARADFVAQRPEAAAAIGEALLASRDRCAAAPQQTAAAAAAQHPFSAAYLLEYFEKLKFSFAPEFRAGLEEFYRRAAAIGELARVPDLAVDPRLAAAASERQMPS